ncbi:MAG: exo-alpha-sialidase [Planctomycetota bacterium]|nr:exo-alpha-sialidase [Planctomycetota bacterium]
MRTTVRFAATVAIILTVLELRAAEDASPVARWSFEQVRGQTVPDAVGNHAGAAKGAPQQVAGVDGQALKFDGGIVSVPSASTLQFGDATFSVAAWVNPYALDGRQQMIVAKNVYSADNREWGLMLDSDNRFRFYLWQNRWKTLASPSEPRPGHWHHVAVTVEKGLARLYVNGKQEAEGELASSIPVTDAPLTIGGVQDGARIRQTFVGALDEVSLYRGVLTSAAIRTLADKPTTTHKIEIVEPVKIWSGGAVPKTADIPLLEGVEFHILKKQRPDTDGCNWTLGVGLVWHKGQLYASYGFNKGAENTPTEEAHVRTSSDGGKTWGVPVVMDHGEGNLGVSHGVFLSHGGQLWAFMGAFYDTFQRTHTRAYSLNETSRTWEPHGVVIDGGFWPMQEPQKMADGNWIMAGARVSHGYDVVGDLPAVAISRGDDFTKWDRVVIPSAPGLGKVWGESTVIVAGKRIINISRYGAKPLALVATSDDYGRTWTPSTPSNLPMATSKPYAGTLSTGQRFLICTTTADSGGRRSPLTIAVSKPGEAVFSKVFVIRPSVFPSGPGVSDPRADFSYPYAVEHEDKLYIGYTHKSHAANELAVIPVASL